ncbi:MAG: efflux RND transporter periplasmic adaptor subunit [Bacteroidetes bacterium]|nr:efflux RND transporter periplasmic adaptor subunit [Bacteroidota bacterium]
MKKYILFLSATAILAACGNQQEDLKSLQKKESEIQTEIKKLNDSLKSVQDRIVKLHAISDTVELLTQVSLMEIQKAPFSHSVDIQGLISTDNNITLSAENGGKVIKVYVKEGQRVSRGQRLIDLDGSTIQANLAEVNTRLQLAKTLYEKQDRLWKQNIGTQIQWEQAKNNYEALQKQQEVLSAQLDKFQINSPIDGMIDAIMTNLGEITAPGLPVVRVVNLQDLEVSADVSEKYVGKFHVGDKVDVYFPAIRDTIETKIIAVGQVINTSNRTFTVHVSIPSGDDRLKPNLLAIVKATDFQTEAGIAVPSNLVQTENYDKFVFVAVKDGDKWKVERRDVQSGLSSNGMIYIESGLNPGDQVISDGYLSVEAGDNVEPQ